MKKTINGNFDDPNSTRDLTGISPEQFSVLVSCVQATIIQSEVLKGLSDDELKLAIASMTTEQVSIEEAVEFIQHLDKHIAIASEILEAINAPYEGAIYETPQGHVQIKEGKEVPVSFDDFEKD